MVSSATELASRPVSAIENDGISLPPFVTETYCDEAVPPTAFAEELVVATAAVSSEVMPWLIPISCCRLLTSTICEIYALGSVGCVGSWFFISATSSVRKSLAVIVELLSAVDELELVELPVDAVDAAVALGFANALATALAEFASCGVSVTIC